VLPDRNDAIVEQLAVSHRRKAAERQLMLAGMNATPALRRGLRHEDPQVRASCCRVLDHFLDEAAIPELLENLDHPDESVRGWALHALACDRCKEGSCRPGEDSSLPLAINMLMGDPSGEVRYQALGLVSAAVHRDPRAVAAVQHVQSHDPSPRIRKCAGWWLPGGPRYERTKPRPPRKPRPAPAL
jgi:HEAT repeat protein